MQAHFSSKNDITLASLAGEPTLLISSNFSIFHILLITGTFKEKTHKRKRKKFAELTSISKIKKKLFISTLGFLNLVRVL